MHLHRKKTEHQNTLQPEKIPFLRIWLKFDSPASAGLSFPIPLRHDGVDPPSAIMANVIIDRLQVGAD
jgi:hypothetical protein